MSLRTALRDLQPAAQFLLNDLLGVIGHIADIPFELYIVTDHIKRALPVEGTDGDHPHIEGIEAAADDRLHGRYEVAAGDDGISRLMR